MRMDPVRLNVALRVAVGCMGLSLFACGCNTTSGYMMNQSGARYFAQKNYAMARAEFQRAVADAPGNADYVHNLATAMKKQGDLAGAERTYRQAIYLDPSHQPAHHGLAMLLMEQGRQSEAADLLQTWSDTEPYLAEPHIEQAWYYREVGDLASAERSLQQALQVSPAHPIATAQLGQLYQDSGQNDRAIAMYQRSLHSDWFQPEVKSRLATLQGGRPEWAPRTLQATRLGMLPSTPHVAHYGTRQPVAQLYPLPTYQSAMTDSPIVASAPVAASPVAMGPTLADPDPAHAPQLTADLPEVQPH